MDVFMPIEHNNTFRLSTICIAIITIMTASIHTKVNAREFFDPAFISSVNGGDTSNIPDLSVYQSVNAQAPGDYRVDVVFNGRYRKPKMLNLSRTPEAINSIKSSILFPALR
jgi:outer membrane usher protein